MDLDARLFQEIVQHTSDIVVVTRAEPIDEPGPEIVFVNPAFVALTGYQPQEVLGRNPRMFQSAKTTAEQRARIRAALVAKQPVHETVYNHFKDGREYWLDMKIVPLRDGTGRVTHFASIERDITARKLLEENLTRQAMTDPLTELSNRRAFMEAVERELAGALRYRRPLVLAMLDIDHFKKINDQHGHDIGDAVLRSLAQITNSAMRSSDLVARLGGEEFAVLMPETEIDAATYALNRLRQRLMSQPVVVAGTEIRFSVSIGVAAASGTDGSVEGLLRSADEALYSAKNAGRNQVCAA